jgi:hypothetical protein
VDSSEGHDADAGVGHDSDGVGDDH